MKATMPARYAVYWAPEESHPLWSAGCDWLGSDLEAAARAHTDQPRRYGFHATLKPPCRLAEGTTEGEFLDAVHALARTPKFAMPPLVVGWLGGFLALRPGEPVALSHPLRRMADCCVADLDRYRRPVGPAELAQRLEQQGLDAAQRELTQRWGYPHVFDHWRFHMTLTRQLGSIDIHERDRLAHEAATHFSHALAQPLEFASLCVFVEPVPQANFVLAHRFALAR